MKFITNFTEDKVTLYEQTSGIHDIEYEIRDHAFSIDGHLLQGYKAFYINDIISDLSAFWRTFDQLERDMGL